MEFCEVCDNLLYLKIAPKDRGDAVLHFCRNCGTEAEVPTSKCLSRRVLKKTTTDSVDLNRHMKFDPTLPRISKPCTNPTACENTDIIYIRYDEANLKYVYLCPVCDWKWI